MTRAGSPVTPRVTLLQPGRFPWSRPDSFTNEMLPGGWWHIGDIRILGYRIEGQGAILDFACHHFPTTQFWGPGLGPHYPNETTALNAVSHQLSQLIEYSYRTEQSTLRLGRWTVVLAALTVVLIVTSALLVLVTIGWRPP